MADHKAADLLTRPHHMDSHGNAWSEAYTMTPTAIIADKIYFGVIPAGIEVHRVRLYNAATQASCTLDLGYEPVNATAGPSASLAYWLNDSDVAAAGADDSVAVPKLFEHPVYLVGTVAGATTDGAKRFDVHVLGKVVGVK